MVAPFTRPLGTDLALLLVQLLLVLALCRVVGRFMQYLKQPPVIGEVIAGILLGPSVLGQIPHFSETIFPKTSLLPLNMLAQIALILFMCFIGAEVDANLMYTKGREAARIAIAGIVVPFGCGMLVALYLFSDANTSPTVDKTSFVLFLGTSLSFTALPILARILDVTNILPSHFGVLAMATAALDDILAWCTLAVTVSWTSGRDLRDGLYVCLSAIAFVALQAFVLRPLLAWLHRRAMARGEDADVDDRDLIGVVLFVLIVNSWLAEIIQIHSFFGAFASGVILPREGKFLEHFTSRIEILIVEFLLPIYFANSGIRTDLTALNTPRAWAETLLLIVVASAAKIVPVALVARCTPTATTTTLSDGSARREPLDTRSAWILGALMNTRGLITLIVLNLGVELGVLSVRLFSMLVTMAMLTTMLTSPLLYTFYLTPAKRAELEQLAAAIESGSSLNGFGGEAASSLQVNVENVDKLSEGLRATASDTHSQHSQHSQLSQHSGLQQPLLDDPAAAALRDRSRTSSRASQAGSEQFRSQRLVSHPRSISSRTRLSALSDHGYTLTSGGGSGANSRSTSSADAAAGRAPRTLSGFDVVSVAQPRTATQS